ncbi:MAG: carnitine dehydratase [Desulfobulbaceae bacterium A2]|nr:MAG: carnitine dehydratase [Desulfobulbaceae bacterium A2]
MRDERKPLLGINVLVLASNVPGPVAASKLARLGASVTKVESPAGDTLATWCPAWYQDLSEGHRLVLLDLKSSQGRDDMEGLLQHADLLLTSFRLSALKRLSLDWQGLHARHPRLCQVAIVGYPAPEQNRAGHDLTYQAVLGLLTPPHNPRTFVADLAGAERAVTSALSLLYARERGLGAGYDEVALSQSAEEFAAPLRYGITAPAGLFGGTLPEYRLYETQQGWIAVAALEAHFRERLMAELGLTCLDKAELGRVFLSRTALAWEEWAAALDLPLAAVR